MAGSVAMSSLSLKPTTPFQEKVASSIQGLPSLARSSTSLKVSANQVKKIKTDTPYGMRPALVGLELRNKKKRSLSLMVVAAVGDVTSDGNNYLIAGAIGVALLGTAFPIFFSRKDICPECDGAGFVRKGGATLSANAAQKDLPHVVCANCNGLGKLGQIDNPIYTPEEWSESGDRYAGGVTGLAIWAVTLGGILLGGALLVYNTSALSQ